MLRILIADDHSAMRQQVRELLERQEGWEVCAEAANGRETVALTASMQPDLVVLDLSMPELDGLQAARQIHAQFPQTAMLILTGYDVVDLMDVTRAYGVQTCLSKADLDELAGAIWTILQQTGKPSQAPSSVDKGAAARKR